MNFSRLALPMFTAAACCAGLWALQRTTDFGFGNDDAPSNVKAEFYWSRLAYTPSMEAFTYAAKKTSAFYDAQKRLATEHPVFDDIGRGEPVREAGNGQGLLLSSITVLRLGGNLQAANDPAKRVLLQKKEELEQKIDTLKYQKAAMDPADYKQQLTVALVELARVQEELDK